MRDIVITGATGVIGRRAVRELLSRGHRVVGVTRSDRGRSLLKSLGAGAIEAEVFEDQTAAQLRQYSGNGAYRHMAEAMAREAATGLAGGSDPAVIAQAIRAAAESDHPETRYAVGALAEQLLQLNRTLPDREFDKLATRAIR
jgi:NAD(P)-dependent dehydrogenase (short-subunit alcohol dehydrogenase family)